MARNLRYYLAANAIALTGAWMHFVAIYWLAYQLTQSALMLGLMSFTSGIPMLIFSLLGGALSDRFPRKKLLYTLQTLSALSAIILSLITYFKPSIEALFIFSALFGILFALESPLKQAILPSLLSDKDQLSKAISWNAIINHLARIAGPFICSLFLFENKIYLAFAMYSASILISALIIYCLKLESDIIGDKKEKTMTMIKDGLRYLSNRKQLFYAILTTSTLGFCIGPYTSQIPSLIKDFYPNYSDSLTLFYAATGLGGLLSALTLRKIQAKENISQIYFLGIIISTIALSAFFYGSTLYFGLLMLFFTTFGMMICAGTGMIFIQNQSAEEYRGRVMGFYHLLFIGLAPISNGLFGFLCEVLGSQSAFLLGAIISLLAAAFFFINNKNATRLHLSEISSNAG